MSKQKWKAWFVTTLVLFTIVRLVETCRANKSDTINSSPLETYEDELPDEDLPVKKNQPLKEKPPLDIKPKQEASKKKPFTKTISKRTITKKNKFKAFKEPSNKVYFKIVDGLALVGGDILIGQVKKNDDDEISNTTVFEKEVNETKLWLSQDIPYGFSTNVSESMRTEIKWAIEYLNTNTDLNLHPIDPDYDEDAIVFERRTGAPCASHVGRVGGLQPIFVNESKCGKQEVLHEILHSLGFVHEQQREDRDNRLKVLWENIKEGQEHNFAILPDSFIHPYSGSVFDIDFNSIMMYPDEAFSKKDGLKTLKSLSNSAIKPTSEGLSKRDLERINYLYGS